MRTYIGVKMIEAEPSTVRDEPGYDITYPDGYKSWSPKAAFEAAYFPLAGEKLNDADVEAFVRNDDGEILVSKIGDKTAVAHVKCVSGFEITETAACTNKEDYSQEIGVGIALLRIKDTLRAHLAFVLQWATNGINSNQNHTGEETDG